MALLFGSHLFFTVRLRFPQRKLARAIRLSVTEETGAEGEVSPFGALATALAATLGTGNIVGVALAVSIGGPGACLLYTSGETLGKLDRFLFHDLLVFDDVNGDVMVDVAKHIQIHHIETTLDL